ncbi:hypothetical protein KY284_033076 [Solanum tuberosum]|nr:hypothetical protein KY284_033076 [Solanum tuberosum]
MWKRKVSVFDVVDESLALAKKANGGDNMMPSINTIKKRSSQADKYPINGCRHQKIAEMARSHGSLVLVGNNSIMYLVSCYPLNLGADIVMHSSTNALELLSWPKLSYYPD